MASPLNQDIVENLGWLIELKTTITWPLGTAEIRIISEAILSLLNVLFHSDRPQVSKGATKWRIDSRAGPVFQRSLMTSWAGYQKPALKQSSRAISSIYQIHFVQGPSLGKVTRMSRQLLNLEIKDTHRHTLPECFPRWHCSTVACDHQFQ